MHGNACRKFTVSDALILVGAVALAFAVMRTDYLWPDFSEKLVAYSDYLNNIHHLIFFMFPGLVSLSVAILILRLRKPRPVLRRLTRQPGWVACTVTVIVLGIRTANLSSVAGVLILDLKGNSFWGWFLDVAMADDIKLVPSDIGCAVAAAWTIQKIGGRWRLEPCWIDRAGRVLGTLWIATTPFAWFSYMISG